MKVNVNYKGKTIELDIPDEKLEELVKERKQTGWEKPKIHGTYNTIQDDGVVCWSNWCNGPNDNKLYSRGNFFTSQKLAENIARYQSLDLRIRRRIAEICEPVTTRGACVIYLDSIGLGVDYMTRNYGGWRFDTKEHARQIIEEFKDRMDG